MKLAGCLLFALLLPALALGAEGRCALISEEEAAAALGAAVRPGAQAGPMGTACQWDARADDAAWVQVQVIDDTGYWSTPSLAPGFRRISGVGREAYVVPEMGGWAAGALMERRMVVVSVAGGSTDQSRAVALLKTVVGRLE
jgi:hypothetical protein